MGPCTSQFELKAYVVRMDFKLNLSWGSYQKSICNGLGLLQQRGEFVDMTIAADGHQVKVHQMVLSLVSPYIKELITSAPSPHPIIFLNKVSYQTLQLILEYAYTGEVLVAQDKLTEFLEAGRALHFKGLEFENMKSNSDGNLLRYTGETREQPAEQKTQEIITDEPIQIGTKRKRIEMPKENETTQDDGHNFEYSLAVESDDHQDSNDGNDLIISEQQLLVEKKQKPNTTTSPSMQYTLSCQGSIQLVLNRYIYRKRHSRKNDEQMWRCTDYDRKICRAYVITRDNLVIERGCAHNHPFHDKQILKKVRGGNMFSAFNVAQSMASVNAMKALEKAKSSAPEKKSDDTTDKWTIKPRS